MTPHYAWLQPEWTTLVRAEAAAAEQQGVLTLAQFRLIHDRGWFRMLIPAAAGGLEFSLPEILKVQEAASWLDGSFGWVIALCGGAGFFAGFMELETARLLFDRSDICVAGTGYPAGTAEDGAEGYLVSGDWRYASGAAHATLFTANCVLTAGGRPLKDEAGKPRIRAMAFLPEQVSIKKNWRSMGLVATGSHDMQMRNVVVPHQRSFELTRPFPHAAGPLYQYPFHQQAEAVLTITLVGMVRHFLDLFQEGVLARHAPGSAARTAVEQVIAVAEATWAGGRTRLYEVVQASWAPYAAGTMATPQQLEAVGGVARQVVNDLVTSVQQLYRFGGMQVMNLEAPINRVWRDIHTASQHALLSPLYGL